MKKHSSVAGLALLLLACGDRSPSPASPDMEKKDSAVAPGATDTLGNDTASKSAQYFPVMDYLKSEIAYVDSLPVGIKKYKGDVAPNKKFTYIKLPEFHRLASEFIPAAVDDSFFKKHYEESSFFDESSNTGTFFYKADNDSLSLQRVDVISKKEQAYDKVSNIYMQKYYQLGDTGVMKRMMWTPQKSLQIITEKTPPGDTAHTEVINVVWDDSSEQ